MLLDDFCFLHYSHQILLRIASSKITDFVEFDFKKNSLYMLSCSIQTKVSLMCFKINYNEKTAKKKRRASWFSRYFGKLSRPSSGDLMKIRIVATICSKTVTIDI